MEDVRAWFPILFATLGAVFGAGGTWAVMQFQIRELRDRTTAQARAHESHAETIGEHRDRITRLEGRLDGLVVKLDDAVRNLERVTDKLEALAIKIAGGK